MWMPFLISILVLVGSISGIIHTVVNHTKGRTETIIIILVLTSLSALAGVVMISEFYLLISTELFESGAFVFLMLGIFTSYFFTYTLLLCIIFLVAFLVALFFRHPDNRLISTRFLCGAAVCYGICYA